eukprot:TRINITY_DN2926_c0_g2_i12.p1 TRINITY_DN2926_c0_g2~~TRINITY_DN2926_c0_g2_i12.p1  ORF type:complete len:182 (-),score=42.38 TRINITY_DN2926_c0_g2_i12:284-829(-)
METLCWETVMILPRSKLIPLLVSFTHTIDVYKVEDVNDAAEKLWVVVTESAWLLFAEKDTATLKAWATLYTLNALKRNLDMPCVVHFVWTKPDRSETFEQEFYIEEAKECVEKIVDKLKRLGVDVQHMETSNAEETKNNLIDIENVLLEIEIAEKKVNEDLSLEELQDLVTLYQKVISLML